MGKQSKRKVAGSHASLACKPSAPLEFFIVASLGEKESKKISIIKLPCTLAELAYEVSNIAFSACEELAFNAGIVFTAAKEIKIGEDRQKTEEIPF